MAQCIGQLHLGSWLALDGDIVSLYLQQHPLKMGWHICKVRHGDHLQWLVVALCYEAPSKQIGAEMLAGKDDC